MVQKCAKVAKIRPVNLIDTALKIDVFGWIRYTQSIPSRESAELQ